MGAQGPYPVHLIAQTLLALLHETSSEVARSKHDPTQVSDLLAGALGCFPRPLKGPFVARPFQHHPHLT
jgi:hypothetical protein